jgi:hypothetical protein
LFAFAALGVEAGAQAGLVTGSVRDSAGLPVVGAEVTVSSVGETAVTSERGDFRFTLGRGRAVLRVRRLGFRPDSAIVEITDRPATVSITLARVAAALAPVVVRRQRVSQSEAAAISLLEHRSMPRIRVS